MAATASTSAAELTTLTLDHILSDLEALSPQGALFALAQTSSPSARTSVDALQSFEAGTTPSSRKQYVELSHQLLASHRTAQRLNSERVSAAEVGLVLPSERKSRASGAATRSNGGEGKATRTDLLHAKVADLQTQVDAWHAALQQAVRVVEDPRRAPAEVAEEKESGQVQSTTTEVESGTTRDRIQPTQQTASAAHVDPPASQRTPQAPQASTPIDPPNPATSDAFEDDDPWNDLS